MNLIQFGYFLGMSCPMIATDAFKSVTSYQLMY